MNWKLHLNHRYRLEIPEPTPSLSQQGAPIGGTWGLPSIIITVIRQVCMYCWLKVKINTQSKIMMHFVCISFSMCVYQKPECPRLELHSWQHHYTEWYRSSGISSLFCGLNWLYLIFSTDCPRRLLKVYWNVCISFSMCVYQKPEYPQSELHGWQCHYTEWYMSSGISSLYLWSQLTVPHLFHRLPQVLTEVLRYTGMCHCNEFVFHKNTPKHGSNIHQKNP